MQFQDKQISSALDTHPNSKFCWPSIHISFTFWLFFFHLSLHFTHGILSLSLSRWQNWATRSRHHVTRVFSAFCQIHPSIKMSAVRSGDPVIEKFVFVYLQLIIIHWSLFYVYLCEQRCQDKVRLKIKDQIIILVGWFWSPTVIGRVSFLRQEWLLLLKFLFILILCVLIYLHKIADRHTHTHNCKHTYIVID